MPMQQSRTIVVLLTWLVLLLSCLNGRDLNMASGSCIDQWDKDYQTFSAVTFIVSGDRLGLRRSLQSIQRQTDVRWLAIVILETLEHNDFYLDTNDNIAIYHGFQSAATNDKRLCFQITQKSESSDCISTLFRRATNFVATPWVTFVEGGDTIHPDFVYHFTREISRFPSLDCIMYRMTMLVNDELSMIPAANIVDITDVTQISKSIVVRIALLKGNYQMQRLNTNEEPYHLFSTIRANGYKIVLSDRLLYHRHGVLVDLNGKDINAFEKAPRSITSQEHGARLVLVDDKWDERLLVRNVSSLEPLLPPTKLGCALTDGTMIAPQFFFTENRHEIYSQQVQTLNDSIYQALSLGCVGQWTLNSLPIHVIFDARERPQSPLFIQVNLENVEEEDADALLLRGGDQAASNLPAKQHFNRWHYRAKLGRALQVWEYSRASVLGQNTSAYADNAYFLPASLLQSLISNPALNCQSKPKAPQRNWNTLLYSLYGHFTSTTTSASETSKHCVLSPDKVSYQLSRSSHGRSKPSSASECDNFSSLEEGHCLYSDYLRFVSSPLLAHDRNVTTTSKLLASKGLQVRQDKDCENALNQHIDVLVVGKPLRIKAKQNLPTQATGNAYLRSGTPTTSFEPSVCELLQTSDIDTVCVEALTEAALEHFVCKAKIVLVERVHKHSALETARRIIEPALQAKKVVMQPIVGSVVDFMLPSIYSSYIIRVPTNLVVSKVKSIMRSNRSYKKTLSAYNVQDFVRESSNLLAPLCYSLSSLQSHLQQRAREKQFQRRREEMHQQYLQAQKDLDTTQSHTDKQTSLLSQFWTWLFQ